jgi:uncharacterized membrane protein
LLLAFASAVGFGSACASAPVETWQDSLASAGHVERNAYCAAFDVIQRKCVRCHSDPPKNGAPFALDTYAATQEPSPSRAEPDRIRADRMLLAVESGFMPYTDLILDPPVEALTCEEKTTLLSWLESGSPLPADGDESCEGVETQLLECAESGADVKESD